MGYSQAQVQVLVRCSSIDSIYTCVSLEVFVKILEIVEVTEHKGIVRWDDAAFLI